MSMVYIGLVCLLLLVHTLACYADRLYSEMGKFLSREFQDNIDAWEQRVEPRLGSFTRERAALSAAVLAQLSLASLTLVFGAMLFDRASAWGRPTFGEVLQAIFSVVLVVVLFSRLLPYIFFMRTRGEWAARWAWCYKLLFYLISPVTFFLGFLLSIASLAEEPSAATEEEDVAEGVDALIEAGEEEGILEESDRELVRSAVEFGDKVVREVMTPRPSIFAVAAETTLADYLAMLKDHVYSRVPVYAGTLDNVTGIVFSHDLLQITDEDARQRTVASLERPAAFVPETKRVNELLREMQREKQHMRIVIDEYGGVAGLVTIEDLLEEIVGAITDEHETESERDAPIEETPGVWIVPGSLEVDELEELVGDTQLEEGAYEATTVAGLVSELAGRIPMVGEVVVAGGTRFEVLASTDRRIERLRISSVTNAAA